MDTPDAEGRVLLDPNTLSDDGTVALGSFSVSQDASKLAYAVSSGRQRLAGVAGARHRKRRGPARHAARQQIQRRELAARRQRFFLLALRPPAGSRAAQRRELQPAAVPAPTGQRPGRGRADCGAPRSTRVGLLRHGQRGRRISDGQRLERHGPREPDLGAAPGGARRLQRGGGRVPGQLRLRRQRRPAAVFPHRRRRAEGPPDLDSIWRRAKCRKSCRRARAACWKC